jgi:dUTP pyrophosphatase
VLKWFHYQKKKMQHPTVPLQFQKTSPFAKTPTYSYDLDSGMDLYSVENLVINPGNRARVKTGIIFFTPAGYEIQIRTKSGLCWNQGLIVLNSPATVDAGFEGEIEVVLYNQSQDYIQIKFGQKVAQAVLCPVAQGELIEREDWTPQSSRGTGGFGSTGVI